jgi:hypothetical protein
MKKFYALIFVMMFSYTLSFAQVNIDSALVASYFFNNSFVDSSGNGLDATNSGTTFITDRFGSQNCALNFNGSSYITFPNATRFQPLSSGSISFWMKTTQTDRFDLINQRIGNLTPDNMNFNTTFNYPSNHYIETHWPYVPPNYYTTLDFSSFTYNNNQWHHFVLIKNIVDSTIDCYMDNNLIGSKAITQDVSFTVNGTLRIGQDYSGANAYTGSIDDIRIYSRPLTLAEIAVLFTEHTGIGDNNKTVHTAEVFPNPAHDRIWLSLGNIDNEQINVSVFDVLGECILHKEYDNFSGQFNKFYPVSAPGVYYLDVNIGSQRLTKKFLVAN